MKIVYCIAGTYNSGGMERVLANKSNYLVRKGHEIVIVTTDQCGRPPFFELDKRIRCYDLNVKYEENNGGTFLNKLLHYPFKQRKHKKRLTDLLSELKADVVVSMFCNDASFLWKIKDGSKKVLEIHFCRYKRLQYARKGLWKLADQYRSRKDLKTVKKYDKFVVLTHEDKKYWGDISGIVVIPNSLTFPVSKEPSALHNKKVIAVGRYDYQKGFDLLIEVWSMLHRIRPEWTLDIIGNGEWANRLQRQIESFGLNRCICLKSSANHIEEEYMQPSLLVMSSRYEGLPMVLLEAQSFGLPIVSFACKCGPRDIITDGEDGFLVPEGELATMADRILTLMDNEVLRKRMGQAAQINCRRFSESVVMEKWERLFLQLVNRKI